MKAKLITYSRLIYKEFNENSKVEIQLEVEEGEKASDVFEAAKKFVERRCAVENISEYKIEIAKKVIDDRYNYFSVQIAEAEEILSKIKVSDDDLPF